jgi:branched-chain amino acid transport system permease protein
MSFAIVILGGLGSIKGTFIGAFVVGYAENAVTILIPGGSYLKGAVALAIMVAVLLIRPKGLFGKHIELEE